MKRLRSWLKELALWLWEARVFFGTVAVVLVALVMPLWLWRSEDSLRITGWLLELLDLYKVARGIRDTREFFGLPGFREAARRWFGQLPKWRKHTVVGLGTATVAAITEPPLTCPA
jgi:hypothetical protein